MDRLLLGAEGGDQFSTFSLRQRNALQILVTCTTSVSIVLGLAQLGTLFYLQHKKRDMGPLALLLWLAIADFGSGIANLIGLAVYYGNASHAVCTLQGFGIQFFNLSAVLWTVAVAHSFYLVVVRADVHPQRFFKMYQLICWPLSLILALINLSHYGAAGNWCWISAKYEVWRLTYYVPVVVSFGVCCVVLVRGLVVLRRSAGSAMHSSLVVQRRRALHRRMLALLLVFLFCYTSSIVLRLSEVLGARIYAFAVFQAATNPLQGTCNAIIFFCIRRVRRDLSEICPGLAGRCPSCCAVDDSKETYPILNAAHELRFERASDRASSPRPV